MAVVLSSPAKLDARHGLDDYLSLNAAKDLIKVQVTQAPHELDVAENGNYLVVSPYKEHPHLLDLRSLDTANQLLSTALIGLKCLREDYATAPYVETFNWPEVIEGLKKLAANSNFSWKHAEFYIVVFRSRIPPTTIYADLGALDKDAHAEATESGGFLK